jgi:hypothetical protein
LIDPVANLQASKVYLFSGTLDSVVKPGAMDALKTYYNSFVPAANMVYKKNIAAEHAMVTDDYGQHLLEPRASPYINDCNFDLAKARAAAALWHAECRATTAAAGCNFVEFNQSQFITGHGMATTGWAYVPQPARPAGRPVPAACGAARLQAERDRRAAAVRQEHRLQPLGRHQQHRRAVPADQHRQRPPTAAGTGGAMTVPTSKKSGPQMAAIKAMVDPDFVGGQRLGRPGGGDHPRWRPPA